MLLALLEHGEDVSRWILEPRDVWPSTTEDALPVYSAEGEYRVALTEGISRISAKDEFNYTPTVTGLSPSTGTKAGGTTVTVTGTGFALGTVATLFKFGATSATSANCTSTTHCTAVSPAPASGKVDVKATGNKVTSPNHAPADQFTYA